MSTRAESGRTASRFLGFAAPLAVLALLSFTWPLVEVPAPTLLEAWLQLFGAWALAIGLLFALARGAMRRRESTRRNGA